MTATPKQAEGADNLDYFCRETGGVPLYVYSLKQGIENGFLAPYRVTRSFLDIDLNGWTPEPGEKDLYDCLIEQRQFNRADMGRKLAVHVRRQVVARRITQMLHDIGRMTKTIVFCADQEEALEMRNLLVSLNGDLCRKDSRYMMRITSNDQEGKRQLGNFIDLDSRYLFLYLQSPQFLDQFTALRNGHRKGAGISQVKTLTIRTTDPARQRKLVERIESLLRHADKITDV